MMKVSPLPTLSCYQPGAGGETEAEDGHIGKFGHQGFADGDNDSLTCCYCAGEGVFEDVRRASGVSLHYIVAKGSRLRVGEVLPSGDACISARSSCSLRRRGSHFLKSRYMPITRF